MRAVTKTIDVCLYDETPEGIVSFKEPSRGPEVLYTVPRSSAIRLPGTGACANHGIYMLLSPDSALIGQAKNLETNLNRHLDEGDWWTTVAIITTTNDSLSAGDALYLERIFANKAAAQGQLIHDSALITPGLADQARRKQLDELMDWTIVLLELRGIHTFGNKHQGKEAKSHSASSIRPPSGEKLGKGDALEYVRNHGINVGKSRNVTFAKLQPRSGQFWANPNISLLQSDWHIVLNDTQRFELIVLHVPARSLTLRKDGKDGLLCRSDKPTLVDLSIDRDGLIDHRSRVGFSRFVVARIPY